jgi:hypothetical protein
VGAGKFRACGKLAGNLNVKLKSNFKTNMASRFNNRPSNGKFGKVSQINTSHTKERLLKAINYWRNTARVEFEPPPKVPKLVNTRTVTVCTRKEISYSIISLHFDRV